jgi:hypothetical protein
MITSLPPLMLLLYPPLKGFSHRSDHVRIRESSLFLRSPRGAQAQELSHEKGCKVEGYLLILN